MAVELKPFHEWIRLEQPRLGSRVTFANDEFFGAKERLIQFDDAVFIDGKYDDHGKWMDGWETRRRRIPGHDHCVIRLGVPGIVRGVDIDTRYFTGNYPPQASIDACVSDVDVPHEDWHELLEKTALCGDAQHGLQIDNNAVWTHLRLNIFPDGGVARLRVYGEVRPLSFPKDKAIDLLALANGGRALACSDEHFGSMHNLNLDGRGVNMGDGWETARRRGPGHDWVILALGGPGKIEKVELDTAHFKGNYPDRVTIQAGCFADNSSALESDAHWNLLLPEVQVEADQLHVFVDELNRADRVTHVKMSIHPDGGVSRLRLFGRIAGADQ